MGATVAVFGRKKWLLMNGDFFHVSAGIPSPLASLGDALSTVVRPSPRPSRPITKSSCLICADAGGVGYCTLIPLLFFTSGQGLGVRLISDEDASLRSGI